MINYSPCGIFLDFKKAFDTEDHSILLSKLYHYGIRGPVNDWFSSFLNGRVQTTQIDNQISSIIIYMKNFLHSDWLRAVQFFFLKTVQKRLNSVQKEETNQAF